MSDHPNQHTEVNVALAELLGLDPVQLVAFTVDVDKDRYPLVTGTYKYREPVTNSIADHIKVRYKLVPIETPDYPNEAGE